MIVLDASALVDVLTDRPARDAVLDHFDQQIAAPGHQPAEVISALARLVRAGELEPDQATQALREAAALKQEIAPIDEQLLLRAFELRESVRVLDGLYVALAERSRCPLLTTDARLVAAPPPCDVILAG